MTEPAPKPSSLSRAGQDTHGAAQVWHSSQVLVSDTNRAFVTQWIQGYATARPPKALLLSGPSGCGKSTLAELCLRQCSYDLVRVDASTYVSKKKLEARLQDASRLFLKQAVLVEDPQRLAQDGGLQALAQFCRKASRIPVVVICGRDREPKVQAIVSTAERVVFRAMPAARLAEHFGVDVELCAGGDLRQICMAKADRLPSQADRHMELDEAACRLLQGQPVRQGLHLFRLDNQALGNIVHANYTHLTTGLAACAAVAEDLSVADVLSACGGDDLDDIAGIVGTVQPGHRIRRAPKKLQTDVVWTRSAHRLARLRVLSGCRPAFEAAGTMVTPDSLPLLQHRLLQLAAEGRWQDLRGWAPEANVLQLTGLLRIGFGKHEAAISRIRRALRRPDAERVRASARPPSGRGSTPA